MSNTLKVKVSPTLWERGKAFKHPPVTLIGIVQNTQTITMEQLKLWNSEVKKYMADIEQWRRDVVEHIENCNE